MEDLVTLHIFARTAELLSFSKAANQLGVKTSTVSRHIRQLEQELGIALFNRSTRALALTEGGQTLWQQLAPALDAVSQACLSAAALNQQAQGLLRLTAPSAYARHYLWPNLPVFMRRYPDIRIEAHIDDAIIPMIDQGMDLAIRIGIPQEASLQGRRLAAMEYRLVASPMYLQQHLAPTLPEHLTAHACLLQNLSATHAWYLHRTDQPAESAYPQPVQGRFRSNDSEALRQLALAGEGLALLPSWEVADDCQHGRLSSLLTDWTLRPQAEPRWIWALYPQKMTVSSKVRACIDFLVEQVHPHPQPAYDGKLICG